MNDKDRNKKIVVVAVSSIVAVAVLAGLAWLILSLVDGKNDSQVENALPDESSQISDQQKVDPSSWRCVPNPPDYGENIYEPEDCSIDEKAAEQEASR